MPLGLISGIGSTTTSSLSGLATSVALATQTVATIAQPVVPVNSFLQPVVVDPAPSSEEEDPGTYEAAPPASSGEMETAAPAAPQPGDEATASPAPSVAAAPQAGVAAPPAAADATASDGVGITKGSEGIEDFETGTFDDQAFFRAVAEAEVARGINDRLIEKIANPATAHALMLMKPVEDDASGPAEAQQAYSANAAAPTEDRKTTPLGEPAVKAA